MRVLGDNLDTKVRWICDVDSSRLAKCRRRHQDARLTTRLDSILADPGVDAVVLATPVHTHYELAMRVLEAGKHVYVEQPLASSAELADDLAAVAGERRRILMCGHTFLYSPPVRAVKRMIEGGTLGDIYFISSSRVSLSLHRQDASVIWDLGPHDFSILLYWLSEIPTGVRALGRASLSKGVADVAFVTMNFPSGIVVNVELSWLAPSKLRRTVVVGSERMAVYEDGAPEPIRLFDGGVVHRESESFGEDHLSYHSGGILSPSIESDEPLAVELEDFVRAVRAGDLMDFQTELARNVVRIIEAADRSLELGGAEVSPARGPVADQPTRRRGLAAV